MKRFTNHSEPWGEFVDVKSWPEIHKPGKHAGKEAFFCSVTSLPEARRKRATRLFDHAKKWKEGGKIRHLGIPFHSSDDNNYSKQTVIAPDGTDITALAEKAVAWLTENSF